VRILLRTLREPWCLAVQRSSGPRPSFGHVSIRSNNGGWFRQLPTFQNDNAIDNLGAEKEASVGQAETDRLIMAKLSANLSFLFQEMPLPERFGAAARCGFSAVECNFIYDLPISDVRTLLDTSGMRLVLINVGPGAQLGDLGVAIMPDRGPEAASEFRRALDYAVALDVPAIHYLAGRRGPDVFVETANAVFLENLVRDADLAAEAGVKLTLEPLNGRDRPDYHLLSIEHALRLIDAAGRPNIGLQLDLFHAAIRGDDVSHAINVSAEHLAHVQIAGAPDRCEPNTNLPDQRAVFQQLDALGYSGWIGCEYQPASDTITGLKWARDFLAIKEIING
jgi:hydroxypyruvate isomerase